ncbi:hypothetical protein [Myxococcus xanthus]|uniref:hypothetical protein n=1 Tax=Myxococcus xanthus TaxID=34 RepID=UPI001E56F202|nr:hypothetical protein [Myxococcus xanthus]
MMDSYEQMDDIDLRPLTREMDLENLGLSQARTVTGVHVYLDVTNFQSLLEARRENTAELKKLLRHLTVFQRQVERLLRQQDGAAVRVHFQGARLHLIVFKPYDTEEGATLARLVKAVTLVEQVRQLADMIQFHTDIHFEFEAGVDTGEAIATMNARARRRQLLFVGRPANEAAKALTGNPSAPEKSGSPPERPPSRSNSPPLLLERNYRPASRPPSRRTLRPIRWKAWISPTFEHLLTTAHWARR